MLILVATKRYSSPPVDGMDFSCPQFESADASPNRFGTRALSRLPQSVEKCGHAARLPVLRTRVDMSSHEKNKGATDRERR